MIIPHAMGSSKIMKALVLSFLDFSNVRKCS